MIRLINKMLFHRSKNKMTGIIMAMVITLEVKKIKINGKKYQLVIKHYKKPIIQVKQ